jgi:hypothetical protein
VDYRNLIKRLVLPDGASPPTRLEYEDVVATAINRSDLADDVRGINASLDLIKRTRGGNWPTGPVTEDYNYVDLVWHECEFRDESSFTYVLRNAAGDYFGCCYLYPMGTRTPLSDEVIGYDVDVSWWVTPDAHAAGYYAMVYAGLRQWFAAELAFWSPHYSNRQIPGSDLG